MLLPLDFTDIAQRNIPISTGARSRCHGLLTIFTALLLGPGALAHSFSSPATYPRCLFAIHSTTLHEGSTKQVYYNTITALFGAPRALAHSFFTSPATYPRYLH